MGRTRDELRSQTEADRAKRSCRRHLDDLQQFAQPPRAIAALDDALDMTRVPISAPAPSSYASSPAWWG
jgi:hypothetical protein